MTNLLETKYLCTIVGKHKKERLNEYVVKARQKDIAELMAAFKYSGESDKFVKQFNVYVTRLED